MILESRKANHVANTVTVTCSETDNFFNIKSTTQVTSGLKKEKEKKYRNTKQGVPQLAFGTDRTLD